jgi:predicted NUDIX family phosphoesterase
MCLTARSPSHGILGYHRRGASSGEKRLVSQYSIGFGGHINPCDLSNDDPATSYANALKREMLEELGLQLESTPPLIGLLNDDSNPVSQVHVGCVHLLDLNPQQIAKASEICITSLEFVPWQRLQEEHHFLETWSKFCVRTFLQRRKQGCSGERLIFRGYFKKECEGRAYAFPALF